MRRRTRLLLGLLVLLVAWIGLGPVGEGESGRSVPCPPAPSDCPLGETLADLQRFWAETPAPDVRLATGRVGTECGSSTAAEGRESSWRVCPGRIGPLSLRQSG